MKIATSRYQSADLIVESGLAPVRITLGRPRFNLGYELAGDVRLLAPTGQIFRLPTEQFWPAFDAHLERLTARAGEIVARLERIAEDAGKDGVVLLCFENVLAGERCHRQQVAAWLERITGNAVEELGSAVPA